MELAGIGQVSNASPTASFDGVVNSICDIGKALHREKVLSHARANAPYIRKSLRDLPAPSGPKSKSAMIVCAGPSLHRKQSLARIKQSQFDGTVIAVDGAYLSCVRAGIFPDFVITLDPHPTRIVRWFGDPDWEANSREDDYFERQDLNVEFRKNSLDQNMNNIRMVNEHGHKSTALVCTASPLNVVNRLIESGMPMYWWNPLVDDPHSPNSLTKELYSINSIPCLNTGGTVGTAAWVFAASTLKIPRIGMVGVDLGYPIDTPKEQTQTYYELLHHLGVDEGADVSDYFKRSQFPLTGESYYTDPTYYWYRRNFLELLGKSQDSETFNCTEGGTLFGDSVQCVALDDFLAKGVS